MNFRISFTLKLAGKMAWTLPLLAALSLAAQPANEEPLRRHYDDKARLELFSGSSRNALEVRFGQPTTPAKSEPASSLTESPLGPTANTLVNNPAADTTAQDTQSETTLALAVGSTVISAFNDSGSYLGGAQHFTGYAISTDGGTTWSDKGALPASTEGDAGDPVLAHAIAVGSLPDTIYLATLGLATGERLQLFRSFDNGQTFGAPVSATPGYIGTGDFMDKDWLAVDNFPGAGQGNAYIAWRQFPVVSGGGVRFVRSLDGGATWGPNKGLLLAPEGNYNVQGAFVTVDPNHSVYVFWLDQSAGSGTANIIKVRKSTNQGVSFAAAVNVATLLGTDANGGLGLNGGFRTASFPQAAVNPVSGHIYVTFPDRTAGADKADVFLVKSTDGGATWSARQRINDDSTSNDQFFPTLAVTPNGNNLFLTYYDRRLDPANALIDRFGVIGSISGSTITFGSNFRITSQSFPVIIGQDPVINSTYMGDYDQAQADNSFFYTTWGDNRGSSAVHAHQPDVRFAKIPVTGPAANLLFASTTISGGNGDQNVDTGECNDVAVIVLNNGGSTATGVSAMLTTTTTDIVVVQPDSIYPNIAAGATAANTTAFKISASPSFVCGTVINLTLNVTTANAGNFVIPFQLTSVAAGQFSSTDVPKAIPDASTVDSVLTVSGVSVRVAKVTVSLYLTHTYDRDLTVSLVGPDNTSVTLSARNGIDGDNYGSNCTSETVFDDAATTSISAGAAPFVGTFRPQQALALFNGKSGSAVNGSWHLRVADLAPQDVGTIQCWSINISPATCPGSGVIYVDRTYQGANGNGSICAPFRMVSDAYTAAQNGNIIRIFNGNYPEQILMSKTLVLEATNGVVNIGQ